MLTRIKLLLIALCTLIIVFVAVSILDVLIVFLFPAAYSPWLFIVSFSVGGIFAAVWSYQYAMSIHENKYLADRWSLVGLQFIAGLTSFFLVARLDHAVYEIAFKAFGAALALGSLLFVPLPGRREER